MKKSLIIGLLILLAYDLTSCTANTVPQKNNFTNVIGEPYDEPSANRVVTFDVVGKGIEPETALTKGQAMLMAERAAVADGYRQFAEKIQGVYVEAYMKAGQGAVNWDMVKTSTQTWLRGVEIMEIKQGSFGIIEVHMQLRVNFVNNNMIWWPVGIDNNGSTS